MNDTQKKYEAVMEKYDLKSLKNKYERACNAYVAEFCKKQGLDFDYWTSDEVGGTAGFATQYFFSMDEIVLDINTEQPKGLIIEWQSALTDYNMDKEEGKRQYINYKSYTMGLRFEHLFTL